MSQNFDMPRAEIRPSLKSALTNAVASSSDWVSRWRAGAALELYYEAGDPHSQLCAAVARKLAPRLKVPLHIRLVPAPPEACYPEADKQRDFARQDAARLAETSGLPLPLNLSPAERAALEAKLGSAGIEGSAFLASEEEALACLRRGEPLTEGRAPTELLASHAARRERLNHYLPGMWQFRGEWFWGLDRYEFLTRRLSRAGVLEGAAPELPHDPAKLPLEGASADAPVEFWFSFRSPYSYLAAVEIGRRRAQGHWSQLRVRPVLPMVMRGLPVPKAKRFYIVRDVYRCAQAQDVPFGRLHDPVGDGVMRLLTVFPWEADSESQLKFCIVAGQSIWAEGLDVRRDDVLQSIFLRSGLPWEPAKERLSQGYDVSRAEANRAALFEAGLWGVPSYRLGEFTTWGQDRLWMIDQALQST